jgi:transmembrane sensor
METNTTYYIDLIARYFYGEATPEEILELEAWVNADPANAVIFTEYRKTWNAVESDRIDSSIDLDREWDHLKSRISPVVPELRKSHSIGKEPKSEIRNPKSEILHWSLRIAALFLLLAVPAFFLSRYLTSADENRVSASVEMTEVTLPDGTKVTLNSGATLSYPSRFEGSLRKVTLQGEAWFEVAHDKSKPFIIASEDVRIRVVGTSFFVNTKTCRDTKEIILATGIVKVYYHDDPGNAAMLFPGDKAELTKEGSSILKTINTDPNFLAWKTKHLVFNNTPLNEVAALLTKVYHTSIRLSGSGLSDCRITATFDKQSLESVLNVLQATLELQVRNDGAGIELSGRGCKQGQ